MSQTSAIPARKALELGVVHFRNVYSTYAGPLRICGELAYSTRRDAVAGVANGYHVKLVYRLRIIPKVRP